MIASNNKSLYEFFFYAQIKILNDNNISGRKNTTLSLINTYIYKLLNIYKRRRVIGDIFRFFYIKSLNLILET